MAGETYVDVMVFDLGLALRKKEELESARLMDFEFRLRARAARLLAKALGLNETAAARLIATVPEHEIAERLAQLAATPVDVAKAAYESFLAAARRQILAERGDPTPHRLA